ncbi:serine--tRNA ligase [Candidatus Daviesbacteria bacterium]|nr:serine--tRNA ligase [Candidatus Daviesbacteria bacterium]
MLDINFIRENIDQVKAGLKKKDQDIFLVDQLLKIDQNRRELIKTIEDLKAQRNKAAQSKNISLGKKIKDDLRQKEPDLEKAEVEFKNILLQLPNLPLKNVPAGGEDKNQVLRQGGQPSEFSFTPKDHVELGEILDIIDIERAAKVSGTRFAYLKGRGVLLELALVQYAYEVLEKADFTPIIPPVLIRQEITRALGYWQAGGNENYYLVSDYQQEEELSNPLYLVGTGEHAVVPMHKDEMLDVSQLPKKYAAFSPCFRREAGSYGKDTRGILRVHQFDKVEMVEFVKVEDDEKERRKMLSIAEKLVQGLQLPYQVVLLAAGDLGFPSAETIDIETWIPSQNKYRETHSISTTTDFQARRLNIKYKSDGKLTHVHILNGTALAIGRTIIAILENYQQADGSVKIPKVLQRYTGFSEIKPQ